MANWRNACEMRRYLHDPRRAPFVRDRLGPRSRTPSPGAAHEKRGSPSPKTILATSPSGWQGLSHIYHMENKTCLKPPTRP